MYEKITDQPNFPSLSPEEMDIVSKIVRTDYAHDHNQFLNSEQNQLEYNAVFVYCYYP